MSDLEVELECGSNSPSMKSPNTNKLPDMKDSFQKRVQSYDERSTGSPRKNQLDITPKSSSRSMRKRSQDSTDKHYLNTAPDVGLYSSKNRDLDIA